MTKKVLQLDDQIASHLNYVAKKQYGGDENAVISDALLLMFLQPIHKNRRQLARLIYDLRDQVQSVGGVSENVIDQLRNSYRQQKSSGK